MLSTEARLPGALVPFGKCRVLRPGPGLRPRL